MGIEEERGDTKTNDGDPEVDKMWDPNGKCDVEEYDQCSDTKVDGWSSKSRTIISSVEQ